MRKPLLPVPATVGYGDVVLVLVARAGGTEGGFPASITLETPDCNGDGPLLSTSVGVGTCAGLEV